MKPLQTVTFSVQEVSGSLYVQLSERFLSVLGFSKCLISEDLACSGHWSKALDLESSALEGIFFEAIHDFVKPSSSSS